MPLAWEAELTAKERKQFETIYGDARTHEEIYGRMSKLVLASKAPGTISGYTAAIDKWKSFARRSGFREFPPRDQEFALYITNMSETGATYSSLKLLRAAIPFYYNARNSSEVCIVKKPFIGLLLDGAMRIAAKQRGPVKKAKTFDENSVKSALIKIFWPTRSRNHPNRNLKEWRTGIRLYTYYFTLCRYDCFSKLTVDSFNFQDDHVVITYTSRKNDQFYTGSTSVLKYRDQDMLCPGLVYQTFFKVMGFNEGTDILNCRLTMNGKKARPNTKLSYAQSLKDSKELLGQLGLEGVTEKSLKASGVTVLLDKETSITDVQVYGGWKSDKTPLYYHNASVSRRKAISEVL